MKKLLLFLAAIVTLALSATAQNQTYRGTVVDADNEPLAGATVKAVGSSTGVLTDADGKFTITVAGSVKEVTVSYVGMTTRNAALKNGMVVVLESSATNLDEVVVTGYGSGKKLGSVVGSLNVVTSKVIEDTPSSNFVDALQGQVAGLAIYSSSGEPASTPSSIRIRGFNSLDASNTPLFICDGAPVTSSIFTSLSPGDIESVTVLKDAASTAIYGSRAANGVIVITTKKGSYGEKASVTIRANVGWTARVSDKVKMMNSEEYILFRDLIHQPVSDAERQAWERYGIDTDWRKEMIKDNASLYSLEGSVRGGSDALRYYMSVGHYNQDGLIYMSGLRRESVRINLDSKVNNWLRLGFSSNFGYEAYQTNNQVSSNGGLYSSNPFFQSYIIKPYDAPRYYSINENGDIVWGDKAQYYRFSGETDAAFMMSKRAVDRNQISGNANLYEQINPIKQVTLRAQQSMTAYDSRLSNTQSPMESFYTPMGDYVNMDDFDGFNQQSFSRYYSFTYTNTAEYRNTFNDVHSLTVLLGQESIISKSSGFGVMSYGQPGGNRWLLTNGTSVQISNLSQSLSETVINSYFANVNYSYADRYFLDASIRRDGSSKFAPGHRWSTFWSVGGMWDAKQESFLRDNTWLSALKLRVNYGTTGNSGIDPYMYTGKVAPGSIYAGGTSLGLASPSNNDLTWETVKSFDAGVSFGFWNRLNVTFDYYLKNTVDMLMTIPWSETTGFNGGSANVGSMRNQGVELEVKGDIIATKDWYLGARVNFNYNKNEITELFNGKDDYSMPDYGLYYQVGKDANQLRAVRWAGVDPIDGRPMWYDKNGNKTKTYDANDAVGLNKSFIAPWTGGFGIDARWKGLSLRADFNWAAEKYMFNWISGFLSYANQGVDLNQTKNMLGVWTKPGDVTDIPNLVDAYGVGIDADPRKDTRSLENSSFVRLKNLTLAYTLPKSWLDKVKMSNITFHFTGRNLWTITDFTGYDPEYENNACYTSYPNTRMYEFGVEVSF
ncbi:MAG: TonB-dependent receptor [Bacteroides sp.]|nr:TonB-dependent receptor [Bacteroides sp.]